MLHQTHKFIHSIISIGQFQDVSLFIYRGTKVILDHVTLKNSMHVSRWLYFKLQNSPKHIGVLFPNAHQTAEGTLKNTRGRKMSNSLRFKQRKKTRDCDQCGWMHRILIT